MIWKNILFSIALLSKVSAQTNCTIEAYPNYIRNEMGRGKIVLASVIKSSNCSKENKNSFVSLLLANSQGTINNSHLQRLLGGKINISPRKITVTDANDIVEQTALLPKNYSFSNTVFNGEGPLIPYREHEELKIICKTCKKLGHRTFSLQFINSTSGEKRSIWGETTSQVATTSLVALKAIEGGLVLKREDFKEQITYSSKPKDFFSPAKGTISFYRAKGPINKGEVLKNFDVVALSLVKVGHPTKIIGQKGNMKLVGVANPLQSGKWQQMIRLKNAKGGKIMSGKVIGLNRVRIEL